MSEKLPLSFHEYEHGMLQPVILVEFLAHARSSAYGAPMTGWHSRARREGNARR